MDTRSEWGGGTKTLVRGLWGAALVIGLMLSDGRAAAGDAAPAAAGAALRLYRDPDTGAIGGGPRSSAPADAAVQAADRTRTNAAEPLTEEPVAAPAGGVKVNLHGRFRPADTRRITGSHAAAGTAGHE